MQEFLNYEIFGLMTMKFYLITALVALVLDVSFSKKNKSSLKHIADALIWPWTFVVLIFVIICCAILGLLTILGKK